MVEQVFNLYTGNEKAMEKVITDENLHYVHLVILKNDGLPEHNVNSNVYITVLRGTITITLGEQEKHEYTSRHVIKIPNGIRMKAENLHDEALELIVVKAPSPQNQI